MEHHDTAVAAIAAKVHSSTLLRSLSASTMAVPNPVKTAHTSNNTIDTSDLSHVLSINALTRTALVEPNVTMEALVRQTIP